MNLDFLLTAGEDKKLFTPGPLTTSRTVKQAMVHDLGSRDEAFIGLIRHVRQTLLAIAGVSQESGFEAVLVQGSGTYGLESVVGSTVPPDGTMLVVINGAYGDRVAKMARTLGIRTLELRRPENTAPTAEEVEELLLAHPEITNVSVVHCETTTGILNPVEAIGQVVARHGARYMVDAMSSFGAIPLDLEAARVDYLVTSANKCLEGVPGFAIIIARRDDLLATEGFARSMSLDLLSQWKGLESNGQFRFTPPTHTILAQAQALRELAEEGGVPGRAARYASNHAVIMEGMTALGFKPYLAPELQSYIITSFRYPEDPRFDFETFYRLLSDRGLVIYPGKVSQADCFRIGSIGRLFPDDMRALIEAVKEVKAEMGFGVWS